MSRWLESVSEAGSDSSSQSDPVTLPPCLPVYTGTSDSVLQNRLSGFNRVPHLKNRLLQCATPHQDGDVGCARLPGGGGGWQQRVVVAAEVAVAFKRNAVCYVIAGSTPQLFSTFHGIEAMFRSFCS